MRQTRLLIFAAFTLSAIVIILFLPRFPQDQAYHQFADLREFFGIPNCLNVISNAAFLIVGVLGFVFLLREPKPGDEKHFVEQQERWPYLIFFLGVALTSVGSGYYHLAPGNDRLIWDRLPMTLAFMSFFAAIVVEQISRRAGLWLLGPLVMLGIASVGYWHLTEMHGRGDLRVYAFVQAYPLLSIPLLMILFPPSYTRSADLFAVLGIYVLAKAFELFDRQILGFGQIVSGHTLKHLAAALSAYWMLRMLKHREPYKEALEESVVDV